MTVNQRIVIKNQEEVFFLINYFGSQGDHPPSGYLWVTDDVPDFAIDDAGNRAIKDI